MGVQAADLAGPRDQRPIDVGRPGALRASVVAAAGERGPTYQALVDQHGVPPFERLAGSAELRGSGPELVAVVAVDGSSIEHFDYLMSLRTTET